MAQTLKLSFTKESGDSLNILLAGPKSGLQADGVRTAMEAVIAAKGAFKDGPVKIVKAELIDRQVSVLVGH